jgi:hypothetical protein
MQFLPSTNDLFSLFHFRLYIYGGHDIREGSHKTLYKLNLKEMQEWKAKNGIDITPPAWEEVETHGNNKPGYLAHHTSVVYNEKMYLYGGSNLETENQNLLSLDLNTYEWKKISPAKVFHKT